MAKEIAEKPLAWRPGLMLRKSRWKSELKYSRVTAHSISIGPFLKKFHTADIQHLTAEFIVK